jgi:hypothetical protein
LAGSAWLDPIHSFLNEALLSLDGRKSCVSRKSMPGLTHDRNFFAVLGTLARVLLATGLLLWSLEDTSAQEKAAGPKPSPPATPKRAPAPARPAAQQQTMPVSIEQALYLVRSTLLRLNDANNSGNYTVLRDLAAPDFQARNTATDLGQTFSDLRRRNFDLYGAALLAPQFTVVPALDQSGMLHLTGYIPTRPQQINFDLVFQVVGNQWRLYGISIATPEAAPAQPQAQTPPDQLHCLRADKVWFGSKPAPPRQRPHVSFRRVRTWRRIGFRQRCAQVRPNAPRDDRITVL